jgi:hypothetical protein
MVRHSLTALMAALSLFGGAAAKAQTTNATPTASDDPAGPDGTSVVACLPLLMVEAQIAVGRPGPKGMKLELDGPAGCGAGFTSPSWLTATGLDTRLEIGRGDDCPAFSTQAHKLRPSHEREMRLRGSLDRLSPAVQVGPFNITDRAGYFELESLGGRRAAARWVRQMLAAVRPCWKWDDTDRDAPRFVRRLYVEIATKPQ